MATPKQIAAAQAQPAMKQLHIVAPGMVEITIDRTGKKYLLPEAVPVNLVARYMRLAQSINTDNMTLEDIDTILSGVLSLFHLNPDYAHWTEDDLGNHLTLDEIGPLLRDFFALRQRSNAS